MLRKLKNKLLELRNRLRYIYIYKLRILPIYLRRKKLKKLKYYNIKRCNIERFNETVCTFGSLNPDKTFYVIRREKLGSGFFSNFFLILEHIYTAQKNNLIPIVDYETFPSWYQEEHAIHGTHNVWEYYFQQISPYTLKEVYKSKNVILSKTLPPKIDLLYQWENPCWASLRLSDDITILNEPYFSCVLEIMKLIKFNTLTQNYLEQKYNEIIPKNKKILGIAVRGTDYNKTTAPGHPKQPELNEFIQFCNKKFLEYQYDYIFILTEDENKLEKVKSVFNEKLLYMNKPRYKDFAERNGNVVTKVMLCERKNGKYLQNLEYLADTYILSRCDSLIAGMTSGSAAASVMNGGKYEHRIILMNGTY